MHARLRPTQRSLELGRLASELMLNGCNTCPGVHHATNEVWREEANIS